MTLLKRIERREEGLLGFTGEGIKVDLKSSPELGLIVVEEAKVLDKDNKFEEFLNRAKSTMDFYKFEKKSCGDGYCIAYLKFQKKF